MQVRHLAAETIAQQQEGLDTDGALGSNGVTKNLTRDYKGRKIGFCCDGCPEEWDRLANADKDARLTKAK